MDEKKMTERRTALIAALIAIPSAILIGMLIHHFVPVPCGPMFQSGDSAPETAIPAPPKKSRPEMPPQANGKNTVQGEDLAPLYQKKVDLAKASLTLLEGNYKSGQIPLIEVESARCKLLLAEGEKYRYEQKIRRWGNSLSDLAVRYEYAKKYAAAVKSNFKAGGENQIRCNDAEIAVIELEIQLKSNRSFGNEEWQKAYSEFQRTPGIKSYFTMIQAEQNAQPRRRF